MIGLPLILLHNNTVNGPGFGAVAGTGNKRSRTCVQMPEPTLPLDHLFGPAVFVDAGTANHSKGRKQNPRARGHGGFIM